MSGFPRPSSGSTGVILDEGGAVYNVKAYGAKGDGATDDTAAITAAITAATAKGGVVYLPQGTYLISSALVLPSLVTLQGAGPDVSILRTSSATADLIDSTNTVFVAVRDLQLDATVVKTAGVALNFNGAQQFIIDNVRFIDTWLGCNFVSCASFWFSRIRVAHGAGAISTTTSFFFFQLCVDSHLREWLINGGTQVLTATAAWIQFDSGCDTIDLRNVEAGSSAGTGVCLWFTHTLSPSSFAPRWISVVASYFQGSKAATAGSDALIITSANSAYFSNCYFATSFDGAALNGGDDLRFTNCRFLNNFERGVSVGGSGKITAVFTSCTWSDNSTGANNNAAHLLYSNSAGTSIVDLVGCSFSNELVGNANKASYCIQASNTRVTATKCRFDAGGFATAVFANQGTANYVAARTCAGYNPVGPGAVQPAVPLTTVALTNVTGVDCMVAVTAGAGSTCAIAVGGTTVLTLLATTTDTVRVPAGQTITLTYTSAPTWEWFGD